MASAERACGMGLKPGVQAVGVEAVLAVRQPPEPLPVGRVVETDGAVRLLPALIGAVVKHMIAL